MSWTLAQSATCLDGSRDSSGNIGRGYPSLHGKVRCSMSSMSSPEDDHRKYVHLADELRRQITEGTLRPGQALPSITKLAAERGWSRGTCRHSMETLTGEGLVRRTPGLGYYVAFQASSAPGDG
jgi:Bacterial regulatory proteins, gntR family